MSMTIDDWVAAMRANPECTRTMLVFADFLEENGRPLAAEAMRMLGERGVTGDADSGYLWSDHPAGHSGKLREAVVSAGWAWAAISPHYGKEAYSDRVANRMMLCAAYEGADETTRHLWFISTFGVR